MLFKGLFIVLGLLSLWASASAQDHFEVRVEWIKSMKEVLLDLEKNHSDELLTVEEKNFLKKFRLIEEAWAANPYDCFFAGWPSELKTHNGKKYCASPKKSNLEYKNGSCKKDELQCQPSLFGDSLCVSFSSKEDMQRAFSQCEDKFQKERKGSYSFLKSPTQDQLTEMMELSYLATDICEKGVQKNTGMCKNLLKKVPVALKSIKDAWTESFESDESKIPQAVVADAITSDAVCVAPKTAEIAAEVLDLTKIKDKQLNQMYLEIKDKFQKGALCRPENIVNNPSQRPNGLLVQKLILASDKMFNDKNQVEALERLGKDFQIDIGEQRKILEKKGPIKQRNKLLIQALLLKDFENNSKDNKSYMQSEIEQELAQQHIFERNKNGAIECPFISFDAFKKGMEGKERIGSIKGLENPSLLTIVDYTKPSNQRRLFVIDVDKMDVLHNTWVGQGFGGKTAGIDGLGSSPTFSNKPESKKSSDGFILADRADEGKKWGPNIILKGIDSNNSNMEKREMVLHGWYTPFENYNLNKDFYNYKNVRSPAESEGLGISDIDPLKEKASLLSKKIDHLRRSTRMAPYLMPTAGCLGISVANIEHMDKKQRNKSQLELLREDLPGSLIFSYSGDNMRSKYFE